MMPFTDLIPFLMISRVKIDVINQAASWFAATLSGIGFRLAARVAMEIDMRSKFMLYSYVTYEYINKIHASYRI